MDLVGARHLDLLVTVLVALTVGTLGVFDVVGPAVVAGATLSTLGLIAVGSLHSRLQQRSLAASIAALSAVTYEHMRGETRAGRLLSPSTSGAGVALAQATDIRIMGVTLARTVRTNFDTLQRRLREGASVRIALIEPRADVIAEAARRNTMPDAPEIFAHRLQPTFDLLRQLEASCDHPRLEVRLLGFVPAFGLIGVDCGQPHGRIYVDVYSHRPGVAEPTITLSAVRDQPWYQHFDQEFDRVWEAGRPVWTRPLSAGDRGQDAHENLLAGPHSPAVGDDQLRQHQAGLVRLPVRGPEGQAGAVEEIGVEPRVTGRDEPPAAGPIADFTTAADLRSGRGTQ
jgi:hypothetical protein